MTNEFKEVLRFQRDHNGNFIPRLINRLDKDFKETDEEIFIIPLNRGELLRYYAGFDENNDRWIDSGDWIILNKIISPKFNKDDLNRMKITEQTKYINTVLKHSGVKFQSNRVEPTDDFAKKLRLVKEAKQESRLSYFLHERGYSLTSKNNNISLLTIAEIDSLMSGYNEANAPSKKGKSKTK